MTDKNCTPAETAYSTGSVYNQGVVRARNGVSLCLRNRHITINIVFLMSWI